MFFASFTLLTFPLTLLADLPRPNVASLDQEPYTYWIDESCSRRFGNLVQKAITEMQHWANSAAQRVLNESDPIQPYYFNLTFARSHADKLHYEEYFETVGRILGHPALAPGISGMIPEPNNDRKQANYRYYCDNDPVDTSSYSKTRWKIRDNPLPPWPKYYTPQHRRISTLDTRFEFEYEYMEFEDKDNRMLWDGLDGCSESGQDTSWGPVVAIHTNTLPDIDQPNERAVVTVCDNQLLFSAGSRASLDDFPTSRWKLAQGIEDDATSNFHLLVDPTEKVLGMNQFRILTPFVLLDAATWLPPWNRESIIRLAQCHEPQGILFIDRHPLFASRDEYLILSARYVGGPRARSIADRWHLHEHPKQIDWAKIGGGTDPINIVTDSERYAFFALLAGLADRGMRLSRNMDQAKEGYLLRDDTLRVH